MEYLELADNVDKADTASEAQYSLSASCSVKVSKTILVSGAVCRRVDNSRGANARVLLFQFGNNMMYRLVESTVKGGDQCRHGQMFSSVLRLRKDVIQLQFLQNRFIFN